MSMLSKSFYVIIDRGASAPGYGIIEVVYSLTATYNMFLLKLISTVKLIDENMHDTHMVMHYTTYTQYVSLIQ